jgi:hypothetical protein
MFGFSLPKLLFTILIVVVVIYGFKAIGRLQEHREREVAESKRRRPRAGSGARAADAEDMVACPVCGTYVSAAGARACGRDDCPYPG